ncbi:hypothetical protein AX14_008202 [Amanita brunnescens Koide BX004]|nr:hypothetical protein AX14_008202 [Amanita brunnescens Koide BX004]
MSATANTTGANIPSSTFGVTANGTSANAPSSAFDTTANASAANALPASVAAPSASGMATANDTGANASSQASVSQASASGAATANDTSGANAPSTFSTKASGTTANTPSTSIGLILDSTGANAPSLVSTSGQVMVNDTGANTASSSATASTMGADTPTTIPAVTSTIKRVTLNLSSTSAGPSQAISTTGKKKGKDAPVKMTSRITAKNLAIAHWVQLDGHNGTIAEFDAFWNGLGQSGQLEWETRAADEKTCKAVAAKAKKTK